MPIFYDTIQIIENKYTTMPKHQPTIREFSNFYQQSCRNKRQRGNNEALQQGQTEAKAWLACFVSRQRPKWFNAQTVANLSYAMRNTWFTIRRDREALMDLLELIEEVAEGFKKQEIANTLRALSQMGVRWGALPRGLDEKLWEAVERNAESFNAQGIANMLQALTRMRAPRNALPENIGKNLLKNKTSKASGVSERGVSEQSVFHSRDRRSEPWSMSAGG